jgi:cellobiose phosphorylase
VAITQHIIGIRPELEGLRVEPCLPADMGQVTVHRHCRGAEYRIEIHNRATGEPARVTVDGQPIDGTLVPYAAPGERVEVRVDL